LLDPAKKKRLLEGLDEIDMSLEKTSAIDNYENKIKKIKPWIIRND
jgi:3-isopropylmalate dehydratase small subunit